MYQMRYVVVILAIFVGGLAEAITGVFANYAQAVLPASDEQTMQTSLNRLSDQVALYEHKLSMLAATTAESGALIGKRIGFAIDEPVGGLDQSLSSSIPDLAERLIMLDRQMNETTERVGIISHRKGQIQARVANAVRGFPVEQGFISSPFGTRKDPFGYEMMQHKGVDIAADTGAPVLATAPGTVFAAAWMEGFGNAVIVDHEPGGVQTIYAHLGHIDVVKSQSVKRSEPLGKVGSSGRSTGPHIHYEIRLANESIDPLPFLYR
jgi:murein DD-endopeptidase MepM/ murein hydrolase activator NlpD